MFNIDKLEQIKQDLAELPKQDDRYLAVPYHVLRKIFRSVSYVNVKRKVSRQNKLARSLKFKYHKGFKNPIYPMRPEDMIKTGYELITEDKNNDKL